MDARLSLPFVLRTFAPFPFVVQAEPLSTVRLLLVPNRYAPWAVSPFVVQLELLPISRMLLLPEKYAPWALFPFVLIILFFPILISLPLLPFR